MLWPVRRLRAAASIAILCGLASALRRPKSTLRFVFSAAVLTILLGPLNASAQQCPQHAHFTGTTQRGNAQVYHCSCDDDYTNFENKCRLNSELKRYLVHRAIFALNAAVETGKALLYETARLGLTDFFDENLNETLITLPTMISVRNKEAQAAAALVVLARLGVIMGRVAACHGSEEIKTSCANLQNLLRISRDSLEQAAKL